MVLHGSQCCSMIALLDYGAGNLRSVQKALRYLGANAQVASKPDGLKDASGAVLPGVGAFDDCISAMQRQDLYGATKDSFSPANHFWEFVWVIRRYSNEAKSSIVAP